MKGFLFLASVLLAGTLFAQPFAVGHVQSTYMDPARANRAVPTEIYYPALTAGESVPCINDTFPLLVFGHGFVMTWSAYQNIWEAFVAQGYVVAFPTTEGSFSPVHAEFGADLSFLITALQQDAAGNSNSILYNHLGVHSALMGHSMGGGSAFLAAAGNSNATTLVTFAAANTSPSSIAAASSITIPALVIAGQNDCVAPPAQHQLPMYDSLASVCKSYISINGGGHCYFAETNFNCSFGEGTCSPNPTITRVQQQDAAQDCALLWLNYYLKGNCGALNAFNDTIQFSQRIAGTYSCAQQSPVVTVNGNFLQSTPALSYQWLLNGSPVQGANADTLLPQLSGNYAVVTTYPNSICPDTSNVINWTLQSSGDGDVWSAVSIFPVPAGDYLQLNMNALYSTAAALIISDAAGRSVLVQPVQIEAGYNTVQVDISSLASGRYFMQLQTPDGATNMNRTIVVVAVPE